MNASFWWEAMSRRALLLYGSVLLFFTYHPILRQHELLRGITGCHYEKDGERLSSLHVGSCILAASSVQWARGDLRGGFSFLALFLTSFFLKNHGKKYFEGWHCVPDSAGSCHCLTHFTVSVWAAMILERLWLALSVEVAVMFLTANLEETRSKAREEGETQPSLQEVSLFWLSCTSTELTDPLNCL